ncbi:PepSY domain-containing protein [Roseomonas hellenica]|uniref:PepSY domain-containing protein n=1 Tax=Plastoroseomonas hellenica TaxID=2687306 RepID=A0ABS5ESL1_9PROT|nr:PepSY-associated TM helix domain-containing protein [Plastoroseomonas hellenica]MBR0663287.1 PepSY domain-containing protein [Plastoroseomonas hellenica]
MKHGFRQSMAWLHTWSGLLVGWVLFAVFLTGTVSYFRPEISLWMRPELHGAAPNPRAAEVILAELQRRAPDVPSWNIQLPTAHNPVATAFWRDRTAERGFRLIQMDPRTGGELSARGTAGGDFFYAFHFQLYSMPPLWGRWIISFCAMFMLVAIVSGIVTHRRIFADFFTFRPRKGQRSWLDGHAILAVLALPYHLMITYTGLVTLMILTMPWAIMTNFDGQRQAFNAAVFGIEQPGPRSGQAAPLTPIMPLLDEASRRWQGGQVGRITVSNPGDANATILLAQRDSERLSVSRRTVIFDGTTGAFQSAREPDAPADETRGVMYGLHIGRFGDGAVRALLFLCGLMGTAMVATGTILWAVKQRQKAGALSRPGARLVEILNVGTIAGLPIAVAVFFLANRLLPVDLPQRAEWEVRCFFIAWGIAALHPLLRRHRRAWQEQLWTGAVLFLAVPLVNAATTHSHLGATLRAGNWVLAGVDLMLLVFGVLLGATARIVGRSRPAATPNRAAEGRRAMPALAE